MKRYLLAAAVAMSLAVPAAHAAIIVDDFSQPIPGEFFFDATGPGEGGTPSVTQNTVNPSAVATLRATTHTLLTNVAGGNATGTLSSAGTGGAPNFVAGQLNMSNGNSVDSEVTATWTLAALGPFGGNATFLIDVITTDPGVTGASNSAEAFFNGSSLGVVNFAAPGTLSWTLDPAQTALLANAGNLFSIKFTGASAWDAAVDNLRVPEPGSLALLGLGLLGLGAARRRKA